MQITIDRTRPRELALNGLLSVVAAVLALALASQIRLPLPGNPVPITLQTLALMVVASRSGPALATTATVGWLALGTAGLPMFAGGASGTAWLLVPTAGYLLAFPFVPTIVASAAGRQPRLPRRVASFVLASVFVLAFGAMGLMVGLGLDLRTALAVGVLPFLPVELAKALTAAGISRCFRAERAAH